MLTDGKKNFFCCLPLSYMSLPRATKNCCKLNLCIYFFFFLQDKRKILCSKLDLYPLYIQTKVMYIFYYGRETKELARNSSQSKHNLYLYIFLKKRKIYRNETISSPSRDLYRILYLFFFILDLVLLIIMCLNTDRYLLIFY
jgi:hypothetical protein